MIEYDPLTILAVFASVLLSGAVVNQLRIQVTENKHKMRPIIVRREYFEFKDGQKRPHKLQEDKILFSIINQGPLPAFNIIMRWYVALVNNNKKENIRSSDEHYPQGRSLPDLGPGESYSIDLFIDKIHYYHIRNSKNCIFGIRLEYEHENKTKYQYRIDGYFDYDGDIMLLRPEEMQFE